MTNWDFHLLKQVGCLVSQTMRLAGTLRTGKRMKRLMLTRGR